MSWISEDPTYLGGGLGTLAVAFLVALKVTQQGKYLIYALTALGLGGALVLTERLWVTDNERIEQTVYGLARAVAASDGPAALSYLTDDVRFTTRAVTTPGLATRTLLLARLRDTKFDFVRVSRLRANAGGQSRRGTAEFRVMAGGTLMMGSHAQNFGTVNSAWSLGLVEKGDVWKVNRITPVDLPLGAEGAIPW